MKHRVWWVLAGLLLAPAAFSQQLLNASYDVARELFDDINPAFIAQWKQQTGKTLKIRQSHGGSSKQARSVAEGLPADVVTFNQVTDIDLLHKAGLVGADWRQRLPNNASPFYSLPVLMVREGNPKQVKDWSDLARPGIQVVFPNPKTSGNGRYTYLAAYAYALAQHNGDAAKAKDFVTRVLAAAAAPRRRSSSAASATCSSPSSARSPRSVASTARAICRR